MQRQQLDKGLQRVNVQHLLMHTHVAYATATAPAAAYSQVHHESLQAADRLLPLPLLLLLVVPQLTCPGLLAAGVP
jgi:hypothetical protein